MSEQELIATPPTNAELLKMIELQAERIDRLLLMLDGVADVLDVFKDCIGVLDTEGVTEDLFKSNHH